MKIDEAIAHAREVAKRRMTEYENHYDKDAHYYPIQCKKCAKEHDQLAEWLEELKQYRAIGTLEDCQAAVERNNEKTRIIDGITECCGYDFGIDAFQRELSKFCPVCGRKIERSGEE